MAYVNEQAGYDMDVRDIVRILFKRLWVPPLFLAVCLAGGVLTLLFLTKEYEAEARILFTGTPQINQTFYNPLSQARDVTMAATHSQMALSRDVLRDVASSLKLQDRDETVYDSTVKKRVMAVVDAAGQKAQQLKDFVITWATGKAPDPDRESSPLDKAVDDLAKKVEAEGIEKADVMKITVSDPDPDMAARIGNAVARSFILFNLRQQLDELNTKYGEEHPFSRQMADEIRAVAGSLHTAPGRMGDLGAGNMKIIQHATPPVKSTKPKKKIVLGASAAAGVLGGLFMVFLLEQIDPTVTGWRDIKRMANVPFLGAVPVTAWTKRRWLRKKKLDDYLEEGALMTLAFQIHALRKKHGVRTLCFSAAETTENNLKLVQLLSMCLSRIHHERVGAAPATNGNGAHANGGENASPSAAEEPVKMGNVLLVESSGFNGNSLFGRSFDPKRHEKSMVDYFQGLAKAEQIVYPINNSLAVASMGAVNRRGTTYAFEEKKCKEFLDFVSKQYDLVVFRGPDFTQRAEFLFLNSLCDATVLVANEQSTRRKVLESMLSQLELNGVNVLGVVLNDQKFHVPSVLYSLV